MKTRYTFIVLSLAAVVSTGGILLAQQTTPTTPRVNRPSTVPQTSTPRMGPGTTAMGPTTMRRGTAPAQTRMEVARYALQEAKRALESAAPDKGGFREKAIANVDEALKNVEGGIAYARTERAHGTTRGTSSSATLPGGPTTEPAK
ncbi:MAG: hypothetical protein ACRETL_04695 [Gammaproteobacteria bacterium]